MACLTDVVNRQVTSKYTYFNVEASLRIFYWHFLPFSLEHFFLYGLYLIKLDERNSRLDSTQNVYHRRAILCFYNLPRDAEEVEAFETK